MDNLYLVIDYENGLEIEKCFYDLAKATEYLRDIQTEHPNALVYIKEVTIEYD